MTRSKTQPEKLYKNQLMLTNILYKFRFGTNDLIADYRGLTRRSVNKSLQGLVEKGFVVKKFDKSMKFRSEPAVYYLSTKGLKYLRSYIPLDDRVVQAIHKNRLVSDTFIAHQLSVFQTYNLLRKQYDNSYVVFTKAELTKFKQYPEQLPDLFLANKQEVWKDFMLDIFLTEPFFIIKKRIQYYITHRNEEWNDKEPYPSILIVCPHARNESKVIKYTESLLEDFDFYVTTVKALFSGDKEVWTNPVEPDELVAI